MSQNLWATLYHSDKGAEQKNRYAYEGRQLTGEEQDIWERRFYAKESFTNDDDWNIREQLDEADDLITIAPGIQHCPDVFYFPNETFSNKNLFKIGIISKTTLNNFAHRGGREKVRGHPAVEPKVAESEVRAAEVQDVPEPDGDGRSIEANSGRGNNGRIYRAPAIGVRLIITCLPTRT